MNLYTSFLKTVLIFGALLLLSEPRAFALTFQGFTATTWGNLGGVKGADTSCNSSYSGSHACRYADIIKLGTSYTYGSNAWVVDGGKVYWDGTNSCQRGVDGNDEDCTNNPKYPNCKGWTSGAATYIGMIMTTTGYMTIGSGCATTYAIPCCK